jgi:HEAT repeat protein
LRYGGKTFNEWRDVLMTDLKPEVRVEAIKAIGAFGLDGYAAEAIAAILDVMKKYDASASREGQDKVMEAAASTLSEIGTKALLALAAELKSKSVNERRIAAYTLSRMSWWSRPSLRERQPLFLQGLWDDDRMVRNWTLEGISPGNAKQLRIQELGEKEKQLMVSGLTEALKDKFDMNRERAAFVLAWLGPDAKSAVPALISLIKESKLTPKPGPGGGKKGGKGIKGGQGGGGGFGGGGFNFGPEVQQTNYDPIVQAVKTLGQIGPDAKEAVPALLDVLKAEVTLDMCRQAIISLGHIGPNAMEAVPTLLEYLEKTQVANIGFPGGAGFPAVAPPLREYAADALKLIRK